MGCRPAFSPWNSGQDARAMGSASGWERAPSLSLAFPVSWESRWCCTPLVTGVSLTQSRAASVGIIFHCNWTGDSRIPWEVVGGGDGCREPECVQRLGVADLHKAIDINIRFCPLGWIYLFVILLREGWLFSGCEASYLLPLHLFHAYCTLFLTSLILTLLFSSHLTHRFLHLLFYSHFIFFFSLLL